MKRVCFLLFLAAIMVTLSGSFNSLFAQFPIGDPKDELLMKKKEYSDEIINQLKQTQTVFFFKKNDIAPFRDSMKQAIASGWDLTTVIFDDISNFNKYASNPKYSYFVIEVAQTAAQGRIVTNYYFTLRIFKETSKKGETITTGLCRVELFPNAWTMGIGKSEEYGEHVMNRLYSEGVFHNWSPILTKAQLEIVSTDLKNKHRPWLFDEVKDKSLAQSLSNDTLYVPQSVLINFNAYFAATSKREKDEDENVFLSYKNKYRICTDAELYQIFQTEKRGKLLFEYVKSSTLKYVSIYDMKGKKLLYRESVAMSYNLKTKDIEKINKASKD